MSNVNRTIIFDTIVSGGTGAGCNIVNFEIETFTSGSTSDNYSYLGYGEPVACKILRVHTISGSSYNSFWSNGEELLDKVWDNRSTYDYF